MVVAGSIGFTGGMNTRHSELRDDSVPTQMRDIQFRFDCPVVTELMDVFAEDWTFTTHEPLVGERSRRGRGTVAIAARAAHRSAGH
jgi:cardiolipin synthase